LKEERGENGERKRGEWGKKEGRMGGGERKRGEWDKKSAD
jgi:hypothetical protein